MCKPYQRVDGGVDQMRHPEYSRKTGKIGGIIDKVYIGCDSLVSQKELGLEALTCRKI